MHLDLQFKAIGKATTGKDPSRPVLQALHVTRTGPTTGELAAADGFILAVVPCTLEPYDVPGLISQECLAAAFKAGSKATRGALMMLKADSVRTIDGTEWPRPEGQFPDYAKILPKIGKKSYAPAQLDPSRHIQLLTALGLPSTHGGQQSSGTKTPTVIHTAAPAEDGRPVAPYGIVMPIYRDDNANHWFEDCSGVEPASTGPADHSRCAQAAELTSARDQIARQQESIDTLRTDLLAAQKELKTSERARRDAEEGMMALNDDNETMTAMSNRHRDERDNYARLLEAAEARIAALQTELQGWQECAALLENERNAAQALVPVAGGAPEPMGPLHARLAQQFYCVCGAHYDEPCQCPDTAPAIDHEALAYAHLAGATVAPAVPTSPRISIRERIAAALQGRLPVMAGGSDDDATYCRHNGHYCPGCSCECHATPERRIIGEMTVRLPDVFMRCQMGTHADCGEVSATGDRCQCPCHATPAPADDHNAYHMLYRRTGLGGSTEVVYGPSVEEAIAALYERSVKWDDLRIVHQDLCWCQHTSRPPEGYVPSECKVRQGISSVECSCVACLALHAANKAKADALHAAREAAQRADEAEMDRINRGLYCVDHEKHLWAVPAFTTREECPYAQLAARGLPPIAGGSGEALPELAAEAGITISARYLGRRTDAERWDHDAWSVTLRQHDGTDRTLRVTYRMGTGHHGAAPDLLAVLDSLLSDACTVDEARDFEEWCSAQGFDPDSRKAERIYRATERQTDRVKSFLGADYKAFLYAERD